MWDETGDTTHLYTRDQSSDMKADTGHTDYKYSLLTPKFTSLYSYRTIAAAQWYL